MNSKDAREVKYAKYNEKLVEETAEEYRELLEAIGEL